MKKIAVLGGGVGAIATAFWTGPIPGIGLFPSPDFDRTPDDGRRTRHPHFRLGWNRPLQPESTTVARPYS
jgi:hypothetical protein